MTPKEFCYYIIEGKIFDDFPGKDADFSELGRYTWPDRFGKLKALAQDAILTSTMHSDGQSNAAEIWTNEDESAEIERQITEDARR